MPPSIPIQETVVTGGWIIINMMMILPIQYTHRYLFWLISLACRMTVVPSSSNAHPHHVHMCLTCRFVLRTTINFLSNTHFEYESLCGGTEYFTWVSPYHPNPKLIHCSPNNCSGYNNNDNNNNRYNGYKRRRGGCDWGWRGCCWA